MTKERIIEFLETTGLTQSYLARKCDMSGTMLHFFLCDERKLSKKSEKRIADYIDNYIESVCALKRV